MRPPPRYPARGGGWRNRQDAVSRVGSSLNNSLSPDRGDIVWPTASQPCDRKGTRESPAPSGRHPVTETSRGPRRGPRSNPDPTSPLAGLSIPSTPFLPMREGGGSQRRLAGLRPWITFGKVNA
jgi:hypothetical protein